MDNQNPREAARLPIRLIHPAAELPARANHDDAGFDLSSVENVTLAPGEYRLVSTGLAMALPAGTVGMVSPRSSLAGKHGITVLNAPGIMDAGYRGEVRVILINHGPVPYSISVGDRIAQLVVATYLAPTVEVVEELDSTDRGAGGFGSTGR